jgi:hypothetical protein
MSKILERTTSRRKEVFELLVSEGSWLLGAMHLGRTSWPWEHAVEDILTMWLTGSREDKM